MLLYARAEPRRPNWWHCENATSINMSGSDSMIAFVLTDVMVHTLVQYPATTEAGAVAVTLGLGSALKHG